MMGMRWRIATSWARSILVMVSGHQEPALTVASLATITTSRPATTPMPVMTPAAGACPSYRSHATSNPSSIQGVPGSQRRSTRSRAVSLPCACWRWILSRPPPPRSRAASSRYCWASSRRRPPPVTRASRTPRRPAPLRDEPDNLRGRRAGPEQPGDAPAFQPLHVIHRNDAAADQEHVTAARLVQQVFDPWEQGHVGAGQNGEAYHVHVLLDRGGSDHLGRLVQAGVDDLHPGIPRRRAPPLGAAMGAVEPGLGDQPRDGPGRRRGVDRFGRRDALGGLRSLRTRRHSARKLVWSEVGCL